MVYLADRELSTAGINECLTHDLSLLSIQFPTHAGAQLTAAGEGAAKGNRRMEAPRPAAGAPGPQENSDGVGADLVVSQSLCSGGSHPG